ncbi:MAG TPA: SLOG family protein [Ktedonobacteraceae bacterium]|nr:SLOG family protein [Ktedonobacteraceae bacterium]
MTGSRTWDRPLPIAVALLVHSGGREDVTLIHGGARGADQLAGECAAAFGWDVEVWVPQWEEYGKSAGYIRNQEMVDEGADLCIAFIRDNSRGTAHCGLAAEKAGIPTIWIYYEAADA